MNINEFKDILQVIDNDISRRSGINPDFINMEIYDELHSEIQDMIKARTDLINVFIQNVLCELKIGD
jgi:hypothetical protein